MKNLTISQILNKSAKLEYTPSQAHKALTSAGMSLRMDALLAQWDASKNEKGVVNFRTLQYRLEGFLAGVAYASVDAKPAKQVSNA